MPQADSTGGDPTPRDTIDHHLRTFLHHADLPHNLRTAVAYSLLDGGKRLRPVLAWHAAVAAAGDHAPATTHPTPTPRPGHASLPLGCAVELIHAFSLVHDDLPAMDDDDLRRGKPTLHIHAGEAMAILAGDAMTVLAFQCLAQPATDATRARAHQLVPVWAAELSAGTLAMIAGQVYDTLGGLPPDLTPRQHLELIHRNKTGALLRASIRGGALAGLAEVGQPPNLDHPRIRALSRYADAVGLMFQIVDDLIDVEQPAEHAGKRTGKDADAGKLTYPAVLGVEASRAAVAEQLAIALDALADPSLARSAHSSQILQRPAPTAALVDLAHLLAGRTR